MPWTNQDILNEYNFMKDPARRWDSLCVKASEMVVRCTLMGHMHFAGVGYSPAAHMKTADCLKPLTIFTPWDIAGHASRETGLYFWRKFPSGNVPGDKGRAVGLLQINLDFHAHVEGLETPEVNLQIGTLTLAQFADQLAVRPHIDPSAPYFRKLTWSAYNAGVGGALDGFVNHGDSDWWCAPNGKKKLDPHVPGDYGQDVLNRSAAFKPLFETDSVSA